MPVSVAVVKRVVLIAVGILMVLLGLLVMAGGAATAALFGSDGSLSTAPARVSGNGVALVVEDIAIDASSIPVPEGVGVLTLSVSDPRGRQMFVGSADGDTVDTYLTGAPYDVVVQVAAGRDGSTRAVPGSQRPPPPATQPFWTRQATGSPAELTARTGSTSALVVMNADASPGVSADLVVTLTVARAWTVAWICVGVGVLVVVMGCVALWRARVAGRAVRATAVPVNGAATTGLGDVAGTGATILPGLGSTTVEPAPPALDATPLPLDVPPVIGPVVSVVGLESGHLVDTPEDAVDADAVAAKPVDMESLFAAEAPIDTGVVAPAEPVAADRVQPVAEDDDATMLLPVTTAGGGVVSDDAPVTPVADEPPAVRPTNIDTAPG